MGVASSQPTLTYWPESAQGREALFPNHFSESIDLRSNAQDVPIDVSCRHAKTLASP